MKQQQLPGASGEADIKRIEAKVNGAMSRAEGLKRVAKARLQGHNMSSDTV